VGEILIFKALELDIDMNIEEIKTQLFQVKKKMVSRQNATSIEKRTEAAIITDAIIESQKTIDIIEKEKLLLIGSDLVTVIFTICISFDKAYNSPDLRNSALLALRGNHDEAWKMGEYFEGDVSAVAEFWKNVAIRYGHTVPYNNINQNNILNRENQDVVTNSRPTIKSTVKSTPNTPPPSKAVKEPIVKAIDENRLNKVKKSLQKKKRTIIPAIVFIIIFIVLVELGITKIFMASSDIYNNSSIISDIWGKKEGTTKDGLYKFSVEKKEVTLLEYYGDGGDITVPDQIDGLPVRVIGGNIFRDHNVTSVIFPEGVRELEGCVFFNCNTLVSVVLPSTLNEIGELCFNGCEVLKQITIPGNVESIQKICAGCTSLESVIIEDGVKEIKNSAFDLCKNLKEVQIPESVKIIGLSSFGWDENLKTVKVARDCVVDDRAFEDNVTIEYYD